MKHKKLILYLCLIGLQPSLQCQSYYGWTKLVTDLLGLIGPPLITWAATIHGKQYAKTLKEKSKITPLKGTSTLWELWKHDSKFIPKEIRELIQQQEKKTWLSQIIGFFFTPYKSKISYPNFLLHGHTVTLKNFTEALASQIPVFELDTQPKEPSIADVYREACKQSPAIILLREEPMDNKYSADLVQRYLSKGWCHNVITIFTAQNDNLSKTHKNLNLVVHKIGK